MEKDLSAAAIGLIEKGKLESLQAVLKKEAAAHDHPRIGAAVRSLEKTAKTAHAHGEMRQEKRLLRRAAALAIFAEYGLDPERLISPAVLPPGYRGKILLVYVHGPRVGDRLCLRSGDLWHREIFNDAVEEMEDLGFENVTVEPAGGALVRFDGPDDIVIHGGSDDFGTCDKAAARTLIAGLYPKSNIWIRT